MGAGKTTLLHHLLRSINEELRVAMISNSSGDRGDVLRWVLSALGLPAPKDQSYAELFSQFQQFLIDEYASGRRVILIFDEAQNLNREALEELRMFTNINSNKDELVQLVLVGQPELRDLVERPDLTQFAQRVSASFHLPAMEPPQVRAYISHRLRTAGAERDLFSPAAADLVAEATGGVPRLINQLCDIALVYAFTKGQTRVPRLTVQQVLEDGVFFAGRARVEAMFKAQERKV